MIRQFSSIEAASIFASRKRAEGFFAEILDEGGGFIYGPFVTGFRVIVSEFAAEEGENPPHELEDTASGIDVVLRNAVLVGSCAAFVIGLMLFIKKSEFSGSTFAFELFTVLFVISMSLLLAAVCGVFIGGGIRRLFAVSVNKEHRLRPVAKLVIAAIALILILV